MSNVKTKTDLVEKLKAKGLTERKSIEIVNTIFSEIQTSVLSGNRVMIRDFGSFSPRQTRTSGMKPGSQQRWAKPPRTAIRFEPHALSIAERDSAETQAA